MNENSVHFIADIGSNFNGSLPRLLSLIYTAKVVGCWGVKFQLFKGDQLYGKAPDNIINDLIKRELNIDWIPTIKKECDKAGLKFGCTPFYLKAVDELKDYVDFLKISSFDVMRDDLIQKCVDTELPLMVSLGLITSEKEMRKLLYKLPSDVILYHCISKYPTKYHDTNLMMIKLLKYKYCGQTGWSDHTVEPGVIYQAVANGANYIEFHLDAIDNQGWENHAGHCWTSTKIKPVIDNVNVMKASMKEDYETFFRKDVILKKNLRASILGFREYCD